MKLKRNTLGKTGLSVTEYCLGVLPMGPLQADLPADKCISIISRAIDLGVNFIDTAEIYQTQSYIGKAIPGRRNKVVLASKSTASDYDGLARSVERSLRELDTDYIDIYHLHAARIGEEVFTARSGALKRLVELKQQNVIKAVGLATHNCKAVKAASQRDDIDIVFPLLNIKGMGLIDGSVDDMTAAIEMAHTAGKGVYLMKALGGGNLLTEYERALNWARAVEGVNAVAVGVVSEEELQVNLNLFSGIEQKYTASANKSLFVFTKLCTGCGTCVEACHNDALTMVNEKAKVDHKKCLLCGYCSGECPQLAIRVI
jgi:aryl-alcohol dehydrogenase-like predicted oxidoreductase/NAD-dependent dihydropyrimidine dehydrogenase PreA subunit